MFLVLAYITEGVEFAMVVLAKTTKTQLAYEYVIFDSNPSYSTLL